MKKIITIALIITVIFSLQLVVCSNEFENHQYVYNNQPVCNFSSYITTGVEMFSEDSLDCMSVMSIDEQMPLENDYWEASWEFSTNGDTLYITGNGYVPNLRNWLDEYGNPYLSDSQVYGLQHIVINGGFTSIGDCAFLNYPNLKSVTVNANITKVGKYAFQGCENLHAIYLPYTVTHIDEYAFSMLPNLTTDFSIPASVQTIGKCAFWKSGIKNATIPGNIKELGNQIFDSCENLETVVFKSGVTYIPESMFVKNTSLKSVTIPDTVKTIGDFAFQNCTSMERMSLPDSIESLGEYSFSLCSKLSSINIPNQLTTLGECAFWKSGLISATIPDTISQIEASAFFECADLVWVNLPNTLESIKDSAFADCKSLERVTLPSSIKNIESYAFAGAGLSDINVPNSIENFGKGVFAGCENLKTAVIKYGVKKIPNSMFLKCSSLKTVTIPNSVTIIEEWAFQDCTALEQLVLPNSVRVIGARSLSYCPNLKSITLSNNLEEIQLKAFWKSGLTEITIPASVKSLGSELFLDCLSLKRVIFESQASVIPASIFEGCIMLEEVKLSENVTQIGDNAFCNCPSLKSIEVSNNVQQISENAFAGTDVVLKVNDNSYAHRYALENNILYEVLRTIPTNIVLDVTQMQIEVGQTAAIIATVLPDEAKNKDVLWNSSNASVVTVSNGIVTAVGTGTATITATTVDGNKTATCTVTVKPITPTIEVESAYGQVGNAVNVAIKMEHNPGVALVGFDVKYDSNAMTLKAATLGNIFTGELDCNLEKVPFTFNVYSGGGNKTENGTLLTLQFEIKSDCVEGDYNITLSNVEMIDIDENILEFSTVNGKITVRNSIPGDVTGDGKVTRTDLLRLAKHFSGFVVEIDEAASDVTGDGKVTRTDLLRLAKHFSGFDVVLGK